MSKISQETTTLSIAHHVFLTKKQRYDLFERKEVKTLGVSLPVWFLKGTTSEPAEEVFCEYVITNIDDENLESFTIIDQGYKVNLPQMPKNYKPKLLSDDEWRAMTIDERREWYADKIAPLSAGNLLNIEDMGSQYMTFKVIKKDKQEHFNLIHFIVIKDWSELKDSITL